MRCGPRRKVGGGHGNFDDIFYVCSSLCPGSGETDAAQTITDKPTASSQSYQLNSNTIRYFCTNILMNNQ